MINQHLSLPGQHPPKYNIFESNTATDELLTGDHCETKTLLSGSQEWPHFRLPKWPQINLPNTLQSTRTQ